MQITGAGEQAAERALESAAGRIKPAVLMVHGLPPAEAERILATSKDNLRVALATLDERVR